jgi:C4-dicarboxylate transporter DctQ subunit
MLDALARMLSAVRWIAAAWVVACFVVMTIAIWVQVGGRYFFNYSIATSAEIATLAQIWMVLVGAGVAARFNLHARIDVLINLLPHRLRRVSALATAALSLWFLLAIVRGSMPMLAEGLDQTMPSLELPMLVPYLGLVIGPLYFAVEIVAALARQWSEGETNTGKSDIA